MIYAVIDTNVIVSSFISKSPESPTKKVVQMILNGSVTPLYDEDVIAEYNEVLKRNKFHLEYEKIDAILTQIRKCGILTSRTTFAESMPDESDRVFFEITLSVEDSFLVTGNLKHYPKKPQVVTPAEFIAMFGALEEM